MAGTTERICAKFTRKTFGPLIGRVWMSRSKVKGQGHRVTRNNNALCTHNTPRYGRNGTSSLQITSRNQQTRRFDRCRGVSSPGCARKMSEVRHSLHALLPKQRHNKIGLYWILSEVADITTFCHRLNWPCSKTVFLKRCFFLYLSADWCWTVIIDIVCFVLLAICLFVCFTVCCLCLCTGFVMLLIKGNLLTYILISSFILFQIRGRLKGLC